MTRKVENAQAFGLELCPDCDCLHVMLYDSREKLYATAPISNEYLPELIEVLRKHYEKYRAQCS